MRRLAPLLSAALAVVLARPCTAAAGDWPHLRGPRYDAVSDETGLADSWPERGPPVLWERELGQGFSSFVAVGGRAFTQFQSVTTGQCVVCLDAETGSTLWQQHVDAPWQSAGAYPGPYATPTWHAGRIYYSSPHGTVGCLDAATGDPVWSVNVVRDYHSRGIGFGYACTPLVEGEKVFLPVGGPGASVVALNAADGSLAWKSGDDPASYCPAFPITVAGRRQIVAYLQNALAGLDPDTGKILWRQSLSSDYDEHSAWPLVAGSDLLISAPFRVGTRSFRAEPDGSFTPKWMSREMSNDVASSVVVGGHVYGFDLAELQARIYRPSRGRFVCLDAATGKLCWSTDRTGHATALAADGKLFLLNDAGTLILASASPEGYAERGRCRLLGGHCWTPPSLADGRLFVRDRERAACVYVGDPKTLRPGVVRSAGAALRWRSRFDWIRLVGREPEYPNDAPAVAELKRWFLACAAGVFLPAAVLGALAAAVALRGWRWATASGTFWLTAFVLGIAATPVLSTRLESFVCTWPASLYAALAVTLRATVRAERRPDRRRARWEARGVILLFVGVVLGYYSLCKAVGLMTLWAFIPGFLPALVFAVPAAKVRWRPVALACDVCGFAAYFWVSGLGIGWRAYLH
jgi:outer membrane protein assembly factor BamB